VHQRLSSLEGRSKRPGDLNLLMCERRSLAGCRLGRSSLIGGPEDAVPAELRAVPFGPRSSGLVRFLSCPRTKSAGERRRGRASGLGYSSFMVRFGPAGWSYRDWKGTVYPQPTARRFDPLAYLARYFPTIEIDSTYYRPPTPSVAATWADRVREVNEDFMFTAKLWRRFTHQRDAGWKGDEIKQAASPLHVLRQRGVLGAVLVQFPWSFRNEERNREWLRDVLAEFQEFPLVVEVRHASWNVPEFFEGLAERGVGFVNVDQPLFRNSITPSMRTTAQVGYVRIHGRNFRDWFRTKAGRDERYNYLYTSSELEPWVARIRTMAANTQDLYAVTNNHYLGKAPVNALMLEAMYSGQKVRAPYQLFNTYREALAPFAEPDAYEEPE